MAKLLQTFSAPVASSITQFSLKQTHMESRSSAFSKRSVCFCKSIFTNKALCQMLCQQKTEKKYQKKQKQSAGLGRKPSPLKTEILPASGPFD